MQHFGTDEMNKEQTVVSVDSLINQRIDVKLNVDFPYIVIENNKKEKMVSLLSVMARTPRFASMYREGKIVWFHCFYERCRHAPKSEIESRAHTSTPPRSTDPAVFWCCQLPDVNKTRLPLYARFIHHHQGRQTPVVESSSRIGSPGS
jgi:hypothetical protein